MSSVRPYRNNYTIALIAGLEVGIAAILAITWYLLTDNYTDSFRFEHEEFLWFLLFSPALSILFVWSTLWRSKALSRLADSRLLPFIAPNFNAPRITLKFLLLKNSLLFGLIALSQPQLGIHEAETNVKGHEVVLAVDVSNSMLAQDLSPNRLERSKLSIEQAVNQLKGERLGIVTFAGVADLHVPVTHDYRAIKSFLRSVSTDFPIQGTAIGKAIEMASRSFNYDHPSSKSIIIITDGENHEDDAIEAAKQAQREGVTIYTIGVGSPEGVGIPLFSGAQQFKVDRNNEKVITKLNEPMLQEIAAAGGGDYLHANNADFGLQLILEKIRRQESQHLSKVKFHDYQEYFQLFLLIAILLVVFDTFLPEANRPAKTEQA